MRASLSLLLCFQFLIPHLALAKESIGQSAFLEYLESSQGPSYYTIKEFPNQKLIPVRLVGGVNRPGYYQVPENTTLLTLLSYSGGAAMQADLTNVTLWKNEKKVSEDINVMKLMRDPTRTEPALAANDIVFIQEKQTLFSPNTLTTITVLSSLTAIILTSLVINDRLTGKN